MAAACARAGDLTWTEQGEGPGGETGTVTARPEAWGDVILARKETPTSYHLSVVIDDALQGVTEVVRGQDLFWSTSVHRLLQDLLGMPQPAYRHHRLVLDDAGQKLSKSTGATALARIARGRAPRRPISAGWSACRSSFAVLLRVVENVSVTPAALACHAGSAQGLGESWRQNRAHGAPRGQPKKRPPKKRVSKRALRRRAASARRQGRSRAGMVEAALAAFAHEVRTPLTGILAISNLLATSDLDERERRWVDTIKAGAEHLASLATLFVDAARSGGPGLQVRQDFFDLRALARNAGDSLAGRAAAKGLQSSVEISEKLPAFAVGDPVRLRAALENLIDNAVKFTEQGSVALRVTPLRAHQGQDRRRLCGLRQRHRPDARRDQAPVPAVLAGQCLHRLALRRRRARTVVGQAAGARDGRRHRRRRSGTGGGTTFTLTVALAPAKGAATTASGADGDASASCRRRCALLSVEDNPFGRVVLNAILTELGHQAEFIGRARPRRSGSRRARSTRC